MKHSEYVQILKGMGTSALKKALLKGAVSNLPFLATGPMNYLTVKVVSWLAEKAAVQTEMAIFFGTLISEPMFKQKILKRP